MGGDLAAVLPPAGMLGAASKTSLRPRVAWSDLDEGTCGSGPGGKGGGE
jgi:hypothetical protein